MEEGDILEEESWLLFPNCKNKTRIKVHPDTEFKKFSLFCPNCKTETLINVSKSVISEIFLGHGGFNGVSLCPFVFTPIHPINSTQKAHIHRQAITAI